MLVIAVCWAKKAATGKRLVHAVSLDLAMEWMNVEYVAVIIPVV